MLGEIRRYTDTYEITDPSAKEIRETMRQRAERLAMDNVSQKDIAAQLGKSLRTVNGWPPPN